jgi:hypothetical protein
MKFKTNKYVDSPFIWQYEVLRVHSVCCAVSCDGTNYRASYPATDIGSFLEGQISEALMRRGAALHKKPSDFNGNLFSTGQKTLQALSQNITRSLLGFISDPLQVARSLEMFNFSPHLQLPLQCTHI